MQEYFETIRCDDFEVFNLEYHQKRMANSVGLNFNLGEYIYPPSSKLLKCKVIYNEESILNISFTEYHKREISSFKLLTSDSISYSKKSCNREELDKLFLQKEDCDEILIVKNGFITDTSIANIAIFLDNVWITPKTPLLKGTTRDRLLSTGELIQKDITVEMLLKAKKVALLNAMIEMDVLEDYRFSL